MPSKLSSDTTCFKLTMKCWFVLKQRNTACQTYPMPVPCSSVTSRHGRTPTALASHTPVVLL